MARVRHREIVPGHHLRAGPPGTVAKRALPQNTETTTTAAHNLTGVFHFCNLPIQSMS